MAKKKNHLTDDDRAVWKAATSVVVPHKKTDTHRKKRSFRDIEESPAALALPTIAKRVAPPKKKWEKLAHQPPAKAAAPKLAPLPELPEVAGDVFKNIKNQKRSIDARIDLHGMTQDAAHARALSFVKGAYTRGHKTILLITGKGKNQEGILKKNLSRWLGADASTAKLISGIKEAPAVLGGSGAFIVTLKRQR